MLQVFEKAIADSSFGMIREQLQYKCDRYESTLVIADRFFPSSQLCSNCSHRQKMPLAIRTYRCPACGMSRCRDLNAALNLENYEALAAGLVASRSVDEVLPTVSAEADSKHLIATSDFLNFATLCLKKLESIL
ncbi:transposase [Pleurocapsales cyanobacterium LEGE 06147]|nr:transposase [Pleurocapsales cyanobacterium LEGE 06147]